MYVGNEEFGASTMTYTEEEIQATFIRWMLIAEWDEDEALAMWDEFFGYLEEFHEINERSR